MFPKLSIKSCGLLQWSELLEVDVVELLIMHRMWLKALETQFKWT